MQTSLIKFKKLLNNISLNFKISNPDQYDLLLNLKTDTSYLRTMKPKKMPIRVKFLFYGLLYNVNVTFPALNVENRVA